MHYRKNVHPRSAEFMNIGKIGVCLSRTHLLLAQAPTHMLLEYCLKKHSKRSIQNDKFFPLQITSKIVVNIHSRGIRLILSCPNLVLRLCAVDGGYVDRGAGVGKERRRRAAVRRRRVRRELPARGERTLKGQYFSNHYPLLIYRVTMTYSIAFK